MIKVCFPELLTKKAPETCFDAGIIIIIIITSLTTSVNDFFPKKIKGLSEALRWMYDPNLVKVEVSSYQNLLII